VDNLENKVEDVYNRYLYPCPNSIPQNRSELLNLVKIIKMEGVCSFENRKVLDAGTGTGHRLIELVKNFPNNKFKAIDFSQKSLDTAKQVAKSAKCDEISFEKSNILKDIKSLGCFDTIFCMGVLHHLVDPDLGLKNLSSILSDNGLIFAYVYGKYGSADRIKQKNIVKSLLGKSVGDFEKGIELVKELDIKNSSYGWNIKAGSNEEEDVLIVDSLLNVNEKLYDFEELDRLMTQSGLYGYSIFGVTVKDVGLLFESREEVENPMMLAQTNLDKIQKSKIAMDSYKKLNIKEKCKLLELLYEPNGYTVVGFTKSAFENLKDGSRLKENFIRCKKD